MTRWTDSDNLRGREASIVGGPLDGLLIVVSDGLRGLRVPDVFDLTGYDFDRAAWRFVYQEVER